MSEHGWKKYPEAKPTRQKDLPHWEDQSDLVMVVIDDGLASTRLGLGRLHGLWDDGCDQFVGEEWRNQEGVLINVTHWKEYADRPEPMPQELQKSPTWKPTASRPNDQFQWWMLPLSIVSIVVYAGIGAWKCVVLGWNFLRRSSRS